MNFVAGLSATARLVKSPKHRIRHKLEFTRLSRNRNRPNCSRYGTFHSFSADRGRTWVTSGCDAHLAACAKSP